MTTPCQAPAGSVPAFSSAFNWRSRRQPRIFTGVYMRTCSTWQSSKRKQPSVLKHSSVWLLSALMVGCTTTRAPAPAPAPTMPPQFNDFQYARGLAGPDTYIRPVPTAVLLLNAAAAADRNQAVCQAFLRMQAVDDLRSSAAVDANIIPTRMLLTTSTPPPHALHDCSSLLEFHDYERAGKLLKELGLEGRTGPFFVTFLPSQDDNEGQLFIVADASALSRDELESFTPQWQTTLHNATQQLGSENPALEGTPPTSTPEPALCTALGTTTRVAAPLLVELAAAAVTSNYHGLVLSFGRLGKNKELASVWTATHDGLVNRAANGTVTTCSRLWSWLKGKLAGASGQERGGE